MIQVNVWKIANWQNLKRVTRFSIFYLPRIWEFPRFSFKQLCYVKFFLSALVNSYFKSLLNFSICWLIFESFGSVSLFFFCLFFSSQNCCWVNELYQSFQEIIWTWCCYFYSLKYQQLTDIYVKCTIFICIWCYHFLPSL